MAADAFYGDLNADYSVEAGKWIFDDLRSAVGSKGNVAGCEHGQGDARIFAKPLQRASTRAERENNSPLGCADRGADWDCVRPFASGGKDADRARRPLRQLNWFFHVINLVACEQWDA